MICEGQNEVSVFARCECGAFHRLSKARINATNNQSLSFVCTACRRTHPTVDGYIPHTPAEFEAAAASLEHEARKPPEGHVFPTSPQTKIQGADPVGVVLAFVLVLALGYFIFGGTSGANKKQAAPLRDDCNDDTAAFVFANAFVKNALKAPATASFPNMSDSGVSISHIVPCRYTVTGYVDAQNSFGALLRTPYKVTLEYSKELKSWGLVSLDLNNH